MAWLGTDALPIVAGWGGPPQLHAAPIGDLVSSILKNRQYQQEYTHRNIADAIKQFQAQRESRAYIEAAQKAGLLPEGDYSGLGLKGGESLADLINKQAAEKSLAAYREALGGEAGAHGNLYQTQADYINKYGTTPGRGGGDVPEEPETWRDPQGGPTWYKTRTGWKTLPVGLQDTGARPQSEHQVLREQEALLSNKSLMDAEIASEKAKNEAALKPNVPYSRADEYNRTVNRLKEIGQISNMPSTDVPTAPSSTTPGPATPQTVVPEEPNKPLTPGEKIDTATMQQYLIKAQGNKAVAQRMAKDAGWTW
jgi:hypothetical protein